MKGWFTFPTGIAIIFSHRTYIEVIFVKMFEGYSAFHPVLCAPTTAEAILPRPPLADMAIVLQYQIRMASSPTNVFLGRDCRCR